MNLVLWDETTSNFQSSHVQTKPNVNLLSGKPQAENSRVSEASKSEFAYSTACLVEG